MLRAVSTIAETIGINKLYRTINEKIEFEFELSFPTTIAAARLNSCGIHLRHIVVNRITAEVGKLFNYIFC